MAGKIKLSFHHKVLFTLLALCWLLVGTTLLFQYSREKAFRSELLNTQLQMYNSRIISELRDTGNVQSRICHIAPPLPDLRVTLVDADGKVFFDNNNRTPFPTANHNNRPEIRDARHDGAGCSVERWSESDDAEYFYSATLADNGIVVRSAAPYTHSLQSFLKADSTFLWIMLALTLAVSFAGYFITRRISTSISRLDSFAEKAGKGDAIFDEWSFPNDELGSIAGHIVKLYVQRNQQHQEALKQERDKIRLKKQLTNNINHEIKTPLASITVCAELLRDHPGLPQQKQREFIDRIYSNTRRLNALMHDVSSITRMDDGAEMIDKEPVNLAGLVDEIVGNARPMTDMEIHTGIPQIVINGNRALLESIFINLINNAIAYSGGTDISITADENGNFTFRDNGCGIPEEHLPHIFERFYRIDKGRSRANGGTGLGLAIVRNAVAIHNGRIKVSNDNGLRFDFQLS